MTTDERSGAGRWVPAGAQPDRLAEAAQSCRGCELWRGATQTVFGEGSSPARVMLLGEQPGDREDLTGEPFVGPAGATLDRALAAAGIARKDIYLTNAVKHFRFEERGKRRIHKRPAVGHIVACAPWLEAELAAVDPAIIVCLGATAALGRPITIAEERGSVRRENGGNTGVRSTTRPGGEHDLPTCGIPRNVFIVRPTGAREAGRLPLLKRRTTPSKSAPSALRTSGSTMETPLQLERSRALPGSRRSGTSRFDCV